MVWDLTPPPDGIQGGKSRPNQISPTTRVAGKKHTRHTSRTDLCARGEKHAAYIKHGAVCTWGKTRGIHHARSCVHVGKNTRHTSRTELCARGEKHAAYIKHGAVCAWGKTCHTLYKPVDSAHTVNMSRKTQF